MADKDFTLSDVLAWARTKNPAEEYDFCDSSKCALAQFGIATGRYDLVGKAGTHLLHKWDELSEALNPIRSNPRRWGHSFGELVERLEAFVPAPVVSDTWTAIDAYLTDIEQVDA